MRCGRLRGGAPNLANPQRQLRGRTGDLRCGDWIRGDRTDKSPLRGSEALASALATDGQRRANPFAAFVAAAPWALKRLPFQQEVTAVGHLVAAVHRSKTATQASRDAAQALQPAARAVKAGLVQAKVVEARLRKARHRRDAIGVRWDTELAALKRRTRSAADEGGTALHAALFGRRVLSKRKKKAAVPATAAPPPAIPPATPDTTVS